MTPGTRLGPYEITALLGAGGMGEVYRARDTRLGRDVAVKVLPAHLASEADRLRRFEQEARAVAALDHPNILAIHDVGTHEGAPFIVSELLEGETLRDRLRSGGLTVRKAVETAVQIAQGLAAAHEKGIVHRDLKPANVFVTKDGHVKILDFGIAKLTRPDPGPQAATLAPEPSTESGALMGTVGYMSPEQVRGVPTDHRTDIFSFGCALYEMLSGRSPFRKHTTAETMTAILHDDPPALAGIGREVPAALEGIVRRCLEKRPDDRFSSAHDLALALQAVAEATPRVVAVRPEEPRPYPGLSAFTEADAEHFFGRETEVAALWRKLPDRKLLAIIGPSGAGKTSFLRAGMIPHAPAGWRVVVCTPGQAPFTSLARSLAPTFAGNPEAVQRLLDFHVPEVALALIARWRERADRGLVVIDQFEELFTLNGEEVQGRFAELLGRIAALDGVHVLLSMRDDFLFGCHAHEALGEIFLDVTPLGPPSRDGLHRALIEPATRLGFTFEDDPLVEEMLDAVEGERGALPLLAFAVARLWEERDRERKLLTREAYGRIGGVAGALAQHAEATLERVGTEHQFVVREIFRNLVTSQGTRTVLEAEELMSVFAEDQRADARPVLGQLVDARLLTSFEIEAPDGSHRHRIEIVHESLLQAWPRLVRWRTEDEGGAQLRDQLRQTAHLWEEKGKPDDLLWTGTSFQEYQVWRSRYPGRLTDAEEAFGNALIALAGKRRRRRRMIVTAVMAALVTGLAVVVSFWRHSVLEARRAEAAELVAFGQLELEGYPTAALAHAIAGLELADSPPARRLALEALWKGPTAFVVSERSCLDHAFTPDGRSLVTASSDREHLSIVGSDGTSRQLDDVHAGSPTVFIGDMGPDSETFISVGQTSNSGRKVVLWSVAEKRPLAEATLDASQGVYQAVIDPQLRRVVLLVLEDERWRVDALGFDGAYERLGTLDFEARQVEGGYWTTDAYLDRRLGERVGVFAKNEISVVDIGEHEIGPLRPLGRHDEWLTDAVFDPLGRFFATLGTSGTIRLWSLTGASTPAVLQGPPGIRLLRITANGALLEASAQEDEEWVSWVWELSPPEPQFLRRFDLGKVRFPYVQKSKWDADSRRVARMGPDRVVSVWSMDTPADAEPLSLVRGEESQLNSLSFTPDGGWLATGDSNGGFALWPLAGRFPLVIRGHSNRVYGVDFAPDGTWLASSSSDGTVRVWPLDGEPPAPGRILWESKNQYASGLVVSPDGQSILVGTGGGSWLLPIHGDPPWRLAGFKGQTWQGAFSPDGRLAAEIGGQFNAAERVIRVWDVSSWSEAALLEWDAAVATCVWSLQFTQDGRLLSAGESGLLRWNLETGERERLYEGDIWAFAASADGRRVVVLVTEHEGADIHRVVFLDLDSNTAVPLDAFGDDVQSVMVDPSGDFVVTGDTDGEVRVGSVTGQEPHLLLGHKSMVFALAIDPRGRWIATGDHDGVIRLWPRPDLSKPPLHTLPHDELVAKLRSLTNLRAVRDPGSPTGWKLEVGPFPGWATVPEWNP